MNQPDNNPQESVKPSNSRTNTDVNIKSNDEQTQAKRQKLASNEPTIRDMMKMLNELQTIMRKNFSQLSKRIKNWRYPKLPKPS